jgi:hypothetical protein
VCFIHCLRARLRFTPALATSLFNRLLDAYPACYVWKRGASKQAGRVHTPDLYLLPEAEGERQGRGSRDYGKLI